MRKFITAYGLDVRAVTPLARTDAPSPNRLFLLADAERRRFVLKFCDAPVGLDDFYADLRTPSNPRLIVPIPTRDGSFTARLGGNAACLFDFVPHVNMAQAPRPLDQLLATVDRFHDVIRSARVPHRPERSFAAYLNRANCLGTGSALIERFERFARERLPDLSFDDGPIHFDLNPHNVWITRAGEWAIADFEDVQQGPLAKDIFEIASSRLRITRDRVDLARADEEVVFKALNHKCAGLTRADLRLLLLRPRAGEVSDATLANFLDDV